MIYFDNSATTLVKPKEVISAVMEGLTKYSANPGRSGHKLSMICASKVENIRNKVKKFINSDNAVFTENCTDALNLAILGTIKSGGHIICTSNDHNASARPIYEMAKKYNIEVSVATTSKAGILLAEDISKHIKNNTYLVCVNHMSNVDGEIADIENIGNLCKQNGILFLVDGAQSAGHLKIDMKKYNIDMLSLAPHKGLYSPQGVGVLGFNNGIELNPIRFGGTGTEGENIYQPTTSIERFESGTLPTPNILGLGAGIDFVTSHFIEINSKIDDLSTYLNYELSQINGVKVYTHPQNSYGVIGFIIKDFGSTEVSQILSEKYNMCVRGGLHCAGLKHKFLGTLDQGVVRASLSYFNTFTECEKFVRAIRQISKM